MTDQEIIIEIAELDGWTCGDSNPQQIDTVWVKGTNKIGEYLSGFNFLNSRDAIVPVILSWIGEDGVNGSVFVTRLASVIDGFKYQHLIGLIATPRQLCEALLRATGKWK